MAILFFLIATAHSSVRDEKDYQTFGWITPGAMPKQCSVGDFSCGDLSRLHAGCDDDARRARFDCRGVSTHAL
jgi:hypothetical protein